MTQPPTAHALGLQYRTQRRVERDLVQALRDALYRRTLPAEDRIWYLIARADYWLDEEMGRGRASVQAPTPFPEARKEQG